MNYSDEEDEDYFYEEEDDSYEGEDNFIDESQVFTFFWQYPNVLRQQCR